MESSISEKDLNQQILDSLTEGVFTIDKDFKIRFINKAAEDLIGMDRSEVIGHTCKKIFGSALCVESCPMTQVLKTGISVYNCDSRIKVMFGKQLSVTLNAAVLRDNDGNPAGGVVSFRTNIPQSHMKMNLDGTDEFFGIVGRSKVMQDLFQSIVEISSSKAPVLIHGETGVGKELVANAVQMSSTLSQRKFVKVNCAVLPPDLLASELFGHVKGAFTDAYQDRVGRFELADGGTIFLDEIGEMPLPMQPKLLRVLQDGTFERVGDSNTKKVEIRIIAATNKNLSDEIRNRNFREDLFYRLNVIPLYVPSLKERREDIPHLVRNFISRFSIKYRQEKDGIEGDALDLLMQYDWPGNIRELENALEYAFVKSMKMKTICLCCLPPYLREDEICERNISLHKNSGADLEELLELLEKNNWNRTKVAKILGVDRTTVWRKLKALGINE